MLITFIVKPYPAIFYLKNVICLLWLLQISKCSPEYFYYGSKHYESWSDGSLKSSLIWVHIVCTIGYHSSTYAYDRGDGNCREWHTTGLDPLSSSGKSLVVILFLRKSGTDPPLDLGPIASKSLSPSCEIH